MKRQWRLILDSSCDGYYNMAVDEAIFLSYQKFKLPTLRIYSWNEPFVTLGYKQNPYTVLKDINFSFVRRITGGFSFLHTKEELTYSLVFSAEDLSLPLTVKESYKFLCNFILNFYAQLNLKANFAKDLLKSSFLDESNFCLSSFSDYDLVIGGKKIGGNAQKRSDKLILQQGSIPYRLDFNMIYSIINGVDSLENKVTFLGNFINLDLDSIINLFWKSFSSTFNIEFVDSELKKEEKDLAEMLLIKKYLTRDWNYNRLYEKTLLAR